MNFTFNGISSSTYGVNVTDIRIFSPEVRDEYEYIPGKDGSYIFNAAYGDRRVEVECYIAQPTVTETLTKEREITGWLLRPQTRARLSFEIDESVYFLAKVDEQIEFSHQLNVSFFTISFNCEPFIYSVQEYVKSVQLSSGSTSYIQVEGTAYNYPIIEISPVSINTGYNNHANSGYNAHFNFGYNNGYNNHFNSGYNDHANTGYNNHVNVSATSIAGGQLQVRGIKLNVNLPINAGETLLLDTAKLTATKNNTSVLANISGTFMPLWAGSNSVYWLADNGAAANITFRYHARWL